MTLGTRLRALRIERKLKQEYVAKAVGKTFQAYSQYELDKRRPDIDVIAETARFYGVSTDFLLGLTDDRTPYYTREQRLRRVDLSSLSKDEAMLVLQMIRLFKNSREASGQPADFLNPDPPPKEKDPGPEAG